MELENAVSANAQHGQSFVWQPKNAHSEQAWQVDSRAVRISGVVVENPDVENFHADLTASIAMIFGFIKNIKKSEI